LDAQAPDIPITHHTAAIATRNPTIAAERQCLSRYEAPNWGIGQHCGLRIASRPRGNNVATKSMTATAKITKSLAPFPHEQPL
jgi:hypothetical protein